MINSYDGFTRDIITVSQRDSVIEDLQELIGCLYKTSTPLRKYIESLFLPQQSEWLMKAIKQPLNIERLHSTETFLTGLINYLQEIPVCTLTVVTPQSFEQLIEIQDWLIKTSQRMCFVDLKIDRTLIAGATIQYNGRIIDSSLKVRLTNDEIVRYIS